MGFEFRPATRERVGLIIGIVGPSGGGKTYSAMRLAVGLSNGRRFAVIDTEAGRSRHYADTFAFDHGDLAAPFTPERYGEAIIAADQAGYDVIVCDSMSHEHAGDGGLLDRQEAEFQRMGAKEAAKMSSWIKPKQAHKRMVQRLLQVRAHLILCFRAEQKVEMVKDAAGKTRVVPKKILSGFSEWIPIAEKSLLYEFTCSFLLTPDAPGKPKPIKLPEQLRPFFPLDKPITEESGRRIAEWAKGGSGSEEKGAHSPASKADLMTKVTNAGKAQGLTDGARVALWRKHCGTAKPGAATVDQLTALLVELEAAAAPREADIPWGLEGAQP